uniref:Uncharacterized protein n=1 Tax=Chenopodium quinoa TaxID=63459 RepID=A0A803MM82_CHEQI
MVYIAVSFLGAIAFALAYAYAAEAKKIKIAITAAARCAYRGRYRISTRSFPLRKMIAILGFILSWVGSIIGIGLLIYVANLSTRQEFLTSTGHCYTMKHGLFHAGGWMGFVACILGQFSMIAFSADCRSTPRVDPYQGSIAMEDLQFASASAYSNPKQAQYV